MHDVHEVICGETPLTTRLGSKNRIDFIVATEGVLPYIRAASYRSLHEAVVSDHILLWADINMKAYFGGEGPSITLPQGREFSLDNIEMRKKIRRELRALHRHQCLPERIQALDKECAIFRISTERVRQYNKLDDELLESVKAAAKKTIKQRQFGYCRSPALTSAGFNVHLWKSALSTKNIIYTITSICPRTCKIS